MRKFLQNKLWRTKAVDMMEQNHGSRIHWRYLDDQEFNEQIRIKLLEEVQEVIAAESRKNLIDELADLHEVVNSLAKVNHITKEEITVAQDRKREERGGFEGRRFVETAEHSINSFGEQYCLADPKKYPEIISNQDNG